MLLVQAPVLNACGRGRGSWSAVRTQPARVGSACASLRFPVANHVVGLQRNTNDACACFALRGWGIA